jgi:surfactin synthase thioesterase subunit
VHGWHDDIVPVENSIRWAREQRAALHILDGDHRLQEQIPAICQLLAAFLQQRRKS